MTANLAHENDDRDRRRGVRLVAAAAFCLAIAGGMLWWRQGEAIFGVYVTAALAWCF